MRPKLFFCIIIVIALLGGLARFYYIRKTRVKRSADKPNILLVTVCSLRQDHLGCYGYRRNTSPNIDDLAGTSVVFEKGYTHIPWTKPATIALMSGNYPFPNTVINEDMALPSLLRSEGYFTCGIIGTNIVRDGANAKAGFDIFLDNQNLVTSKDPNTVQADTIADRAIKILGGIEPGRQPVFLWLFFKDPHWPYLPPPGYKDKFVNDLFYAGQSQELSVNSEYNNSIGGIGEARLKGEDGEFITDKAYYIAQYDAQIAYMDTQFGRVIDFLKQKMNYDEWAIIFLSDHGENITEDNYFFDHGYKLTEGLVRIPLIVKFPRQKKSGLIKEPVSICDVYPTILSLSGSRQSVNKDGFPETRLNRKTLLRRIFNPGRAIMLENSQGHENGGIKLTGSVWKDYKLIYDPGKDEKRLYDISEFEVLIKDFSRAHYAAIKKMFKFIKIFFDKPDKEYAPGREELRSLGYLQ